MRNLIAIFLCLTALSSSAQELHLNKRRIDTLNGVNFAQSIADADLISREKEILKQAKMGNIPSFLRKLVPIKIDKIISGVPYKLVVWVTPDYFAIGTDNTYFYTPTTPMLAQRIADFTHCILPTKLIVDEIYKQAAIKLNPQPITPSSAMITVPVFIAHNQLVREQLKSKNPSGELGRLTAGNKKDIILSNKIFGQTSARVVIYGWHTPEGKAIQPVYNKHTSNWADYSHGVRLVSKIAELNGKKIQITKLLKDPVLNELVSDEGIISKAKYPTK